MKSVIFSAEYLSNKLFPLNLSPVSWSPLYMQPHEIKSVFMFIFKNNNLRNYNQDSRSNNWRSEDLKWFLIDAWVQIWMTFYPYHFTLQKTFSVVSKFRCHPQLNSPWWKRLDSFLKTTFWENQQSTKWCKSHVTAVHLLVRCSIHNLGALSP